MSDGLHSYCRECRVQYGKKWKSRNKPHLAEYRRDYIREYRKKHGDEMRAYQREWMQKFRASDPERYERTMKEYYAKTKDQSLARVREWRKANPKKHRENLWLAQLRRKFGMTRADYDRMFEAQGGVCAICRKPAKNGRPLSTDHCHTRNKIRGLLCQPCNMGIGLFKDDPKLFEAAAAYILSHL